MRLRNFLPKLPQVLITVNRDANIPVESGQKQINRDANIPVESGQKQINRDANIPVYSGGFAMHDAKIPIESTGGIIRDAIIPQFSDGIDGFSLGHGWNVFDLLKISLVHQWNVQQNDFSGIYSRNITHNWTVIEAIFNGPLTHTWRVIPPLPTTFINNDIQRPVAVLTKAP